MELWVYLVLLACSLAFAGTLIYVVTGPATKMRPPEASLLIIVLILLMLTVETTIIAVVGGSGREMAWVLLAQIIISVWLVSAAEWIVHKVNAFLPYDRE